MSGQPTSWWARYRKWIIAALLIYAGLMAALILLSQGPDNRPFVYQIF